MQQKWTLTSCNIPNVTKLKIIQKLKKYPNETNGTQTCPIKSVYIKKDGPSEMQNFKGAVWSVIMYVCCFIFYLKLLLHWKI